MFLPTQHVGDGLASSLVFADSKDEEEAKDWRGRREAKSDGWSRCTRSRHGQGICESLCHICYDCGTLV